MTRETFQTSSFLDDRIVAATPQSHEFSIEQLIEAERPATPSPVRFVFHIAYCCSTLLSRALDILGRTQVYREPVHLHQLAVIKRRPHDFPPRLSAHRPRLLRFSLAMLSKVWGDQVVPIVKPTDSCNNIIADILSNDPDSRAVLLYSQAREFITSNLKSAGRRAFLKNFLARSVRENAQDPSSPLRGVDVSGLAEAEAAAYVWMTQVRSYRAALRMRTDQCVCLDAATLLADTPRVLTACGEFLRLGLSDADIETVMGSGLWDRHAKDRGRRYSPADRRQEMTVLPDALEREIRTGLDWIERFDGSPADIRFDREIGAGRG